ncbi:tetratricopeptide repeat protein [Planctomycetales bacterium ZRK34]|nr:tetratricopeptide repeat protein [Planctomycetales bacterium ZRK34]
MMWMQQVNTEEFLRVVGPALQRCGADELARQVNQRWTPNQLCQMLHDEAADVRKVACVVLGLVGDARSLRCLTRALRDADPHINQLAEHALWSVWFRLGSSEAQKHFRRGLAAMENDQHALAVSHFRQAQLAGPTFASAYHQCAIAHYMIDEYEPAIECCRQAVELMPGHFAAYSTMGHCFAHLGQFAEAADCYRRSLAINPRMEGIATALGRIERSLAKV